LQQIEHQIYGQVRLHFPKNFKPADQFTRFLDIGCGWGTLVAYAAKNTGCDATGVTLSKNQTKFGTERIAKNGVNPLSVCSLDTIVLTQFIDSR